MVAPASQKALPEQLSLLEPAENMAAYEYSVLVTSLACEVVSIVQHYRDRGDCENNFDEIKNQCTLKGRKGLGRICHPKNQALPIDSPDDCIGL